MIWDIIKQQLYITKDSQQDNQWCVLFCVCPSGYILWINYCLCLNPTEDRDSKKYNFLSDFIEYNLGYFFSIAIHIKGYYFSINILLQLKFKCCLSRGLIFFFSKEVYLRTPFKGISLRNRCAHMRVIKF